MLASDIIDRARIVLQDTESARWADAELLKWINDGQRAIVVVRPDASTLNTTINLTTGTKQAIPADGIRLMDVVRNILANNGAGRAVRYVDREVLDSHDPSWHMSTAAVTVKQYVYDNRDPKNFYVYPPAAAGAKLEIIYSKNPTDVAAAGSTLALEDIYAEPLLNYVLFRAYSKDAEYGANAGLSDKYFGIFQALLGIKSRKDSAYSPDLNDRGAAPNPAALQNGGV